MFLGRAFYSWGLWVGWGGGGALWVCSNVKRTWVCVVHFRDYKCSFGTPEGVHSQKAHSRSFALPVPPRLLNGKKNYDRRLCTVLELVLSRGEKHFMPRPQNRILVPLRGSFQNFPSSTPVLLFLLYGSSPGTLLSQCLSPTRCMNAGYQ